jgi:disulfide bond formation protein DsbB
MVILLFVGILKRDKNVVYYALPLSVIGLLISIYHNLLYYHILPESIAPCVSGVSCTTKFIEYFGFVTIPFLSLVALTTITASMIIYLIKTKHEYRT